MKHLFCSKDGTLNNFWNNFLENQRFKFLINEVKKKDQELFFSMELIKLDVFDESVSLTYRISEHICTVATWKEKIWFELGNHVIQEKNKEVLDKLEYLLTITEAQELFRDFVFIDLFEKYNYPL